MDKIKKEEVIKIPKKEKELIIKEQSEEKNPATLITLAIKQKVPVKTLERLMALQERWEKNEAKKEYDDAMSKFQAQCPIIKKDKSVLEKDKRSVRYKYAPLDSIVEQTKGYISENGLSYTIRTESDDKFLTATCRVTHRAGHSEDFNFKVPIGIESFMSDVQKYGARLTFAKRYVFCNAFGILTGDEDNDAVEENKEQKTQSGLETLIKMIETADIQTLEEFKTKMEKSYKYTPNQKKQFIELVDKKIIEINKEQETV